MYYCSVFVFALAQHRVIKKNIYVSGRKRKSSEATSSSSSSSSGAEGVAEEETAEEEDDPNLPVIKFDVTNENGTTIEPPTPVGIGEVMSFV